MDAEGSWWAAGSVEASGDVVLGSSLDFPAYSLYSPYSHYPSLSTATEPPELYCFSHVHSSVPSSPVHGSQWSSGYPGSLSLHEYRKNLSQPDTTVSPDIRRGRTLKRKAGTLNLSQTRTFTDFSLSSSPVSSAPSSPPPLSFSQSLVSVISHNSDKDIANIFPAFSAVSLSNSRDLSLASNRSATRRKQTIDTQISFRDRLEKVPATQDTPPFSHRKSVSDSKVLDLKKASFTLLHEGTAFEILNPRDSLRLSRIISTPETKLASSGSGEYDTTSGPLEDLRSIMSSDRTPSRRESDMPPEGTQRRATPLRSLFDDLPTAYSHITGDHNPMMVTPSSGTESRSLFLPQHADRAPVTSSEASGILSENDQFDHQMEESGSASDVNEHRSIYHQLSIGSSAGAKGMAGNFARSLLRRPKRARAAKDRLSNFLFPRSKLDHEGNIQTQPGRSTPEDPLFSISSDYIDEQSIEEPPFVGVFSESTSSLNLHQPNYHSARGRIDKSSTISNIAHQGYRRRSTGRSRERPVTLFPNPFRHSRRTSSPSPLQNEFRRFPCQHRAPHDESPQDTHVRRETRLDLVGDDPTTPLPSIRGRLESQGNVEQAENVYRDSATPARQLSENTESGGRMTFDTNEEKLSEQLAAVDLAASPSRPLTADPHENSTFIPYASSTGTLGAYTSRVSKEASTQDRSPGSTVSARHNAPFSTEENTNDETCKEDFGSGEHKETLRSTDYPTHSYPYNGQSTTSESQNLEHGTFAASSSEMQDLGPGSSQSSSCQQFSENSITPPRPRLRLKTGLRDLRSWATPHGGFSNSYSRLGQEQSRTVFRSSRHSEMMQDDEQDWETIPESDHLSRNTFDTFVGQGAHRSGYTAPYTSRFGQAMTGSSLADYSSYGSLAQPETSSWTPFDLSSSPPLPQTSSFFHPQHADLTNTNNLPRSFNMELSASSGHYFQNINPLGAHVPRLSATTNFSVGAPRPHSARAYRHPTPLGGSHTNPFRSSAPKIPRGGDTSPDRLELASGRASRVGGTSYHSKFSFLEQGHITEEDTGLQSDFGTLGDVSTPTAGQSLPLQPRSPGTPLLHRTPSASSGWVTILSTHESPVLSDTPSTLPSRYQILTQTSRSRPGRLGRVKGPPSPGRGVTDSANDAANAAPGASQNQAAAQSSSTDRLITGSSDKPTPVRSTPGSLYQSIRARGQTDRSQRRSSNNIELQEWPQRSLGRENLGAKHGRGNDADMAATFSRPSLKRGSSTAALLAARERTRTTFNSASTSPRRTKRYRTDAEVRERLRIMDRMSVADIARPQSARVLPRSSRFTGDEESVDSNLHCPSETSREEDPASFDFTLSVRMASSDSYRFGHILA
ncbi:conserved hypothetical protein [Paecilomyces variotii No. 5]|uniref:Uncharacterized protein n=1 Tax=Byssochlamys spectabilis (strain No. 5 / NBRC 109023) TaxID=1356009 RepID=V5HTU9_BYSSN|nr:conserved hypothetical protein [Paecilomyces variotii No. 5]